MKRGGSVRLESRSGHDMSECFRELTSEIAPIRHDFGDSKTHAVVRSAFPDFELVFVSSGYEALRSLNLT